MAGIRSTIVTYENREPLLSRWPRIWTAQAFHFRAGLVFQQTLKRSINLRYDSASALTSLLLNTRYHPQLAPMASQLAAMYSYNFCKVLQWLYQALWLSNIFSTLQAWSGINTNHITG